MEPEISYFGLQAHIGTTKHMGGMETTRELISLCGIAEDSVVLELGCGVGATACYLAQEIGCRVVGVDIREAMVRQSEERAQRVGVTDRVAFRVADARDLPFEDCSFDAVIAESVGTFIAEKQRVVDEGARVTRGCGMVGFNEEIWLKPPPPALAEEIKFVWDIEHGR